MDCPFAEGAPPSPLPATARARLVVRPLGEHLSKKERNNQSGSCRPCSNPSGFSDRNSLATQRPRRRRSTHPGAVRRGCLSLEHGAHPHFVCTNAETLLARSAFVAFRERDRAGGADVKLRALPAPHYSNPQGNTHRAAAEAALGRFERHPQRTTGVERSGGALGRSFRGPHRRRKSPGKRGPHARARRRGARRRDREGANRNPERCALTCAQEHSPFAWHCPVGQSASS